MTIASAARKMTPVIALGGASILTATMVLAAPDAGLLALSSLIVAWVVIGFVRVVILLGFARQMTLYFSRASAPA
jgi:hypothetical protein